MVCLFRGLVESKDSVSLVQMRLLIKQTVLYTGKGVDVEIKQERMRQRNGERKTSFLSQLS